MPPPREETHQRCVSTPLGPLRITADERGICAVEFARSPSGKQKATALMRLCMVQLKEYFAGTRKAFRVELHLQGTPFQKSVWREVARVPFGSVVTYAELARRIGHPRAARAVGSALHQNPFALLL